MPLGSGDYDRRVLIQVAVVTRDRAGDVIKTWAADSADNFQRWARKRDNRGFEVQGAQEVTHQADTVWSLRSDSQSRAIFPETHRFFYKGRIYEIVGIQETQDQRGATLEFLTSTRPDGTGARGIVSGNGK